MCIRDSLRKLHGAVGVLHVTRVVETLRACLLYTSYLTCGIDLLLLSAATVAFIILDYTIPAIITGVILVMQPVILIVASNLVGKKL